MLTLGVGPDIAAEMLITARDNATRVRNTFAKMCGVAPAPEKTTAAGTASTAGGDRQANAALPSVDRPMRRARTHHPVRRQAHRRRPLEERHHRLKRDLVSELYQLLPDVALLAEGSTSATPVSSRRVHGSWRRATNMCSRGSSAWS